MEASLSDVRSLRGGIYENQNSGAAGTENNNYSQVKGRKISALRDNLNNSCYSLVEVGHPVLTLENLHCRASTDPPSGKKDQARSVPDRGSQRIEQRSWSWRNEDKRYLRTEPADWRTTGVHATRKNGSRSCWAVYDWGKERLPEERAGRGATNTIRRGSDRRKESMTGKKERGKSVQEPRLQIFGTLSSSLFRRDRA